MGEDRWHNGRTGGSEILVLNVVHGTESFYEDLGRADIHLGQGSPLRPDTLMQTDIAT